MIQTKKMTSFKYKLVYTIVSLLFLLNLSAQKDGIRGYGSFEFVVLDTHEGSTYTNGGGGVIVNNNLILGVYVSTLTKPFRWDLFTAMNNPKLEVVPLTKNEYATNSTLTNFDIGGRIGFNIAPEKSFQSTISLMVGFSTINYLESYLDRTVELDDPNLEILPVLPLDITHYDFNLSPQLDLQFRVGRAFKISFILGYKFQNTVISDRNIFPDIENLLLDSKMFGGAYLGLGFTFGNL
jgi:hypothetical protein